jgi:uncharacterized protein (TIGR01777 family)
MRILIPGGSGLIGMRLCQLLKKDRHEVIVLSRTPEISAGRLPAGITCVGWDGHTADSWAHLIDSETTIINLVGEYPVSWLWPQTEQHAIRNSRLGSVQAVAEAVRRAPAPPRLLLQASAVDYYGDCEDDMVVEESPVGEGWRAHLTSEWEQAAAAIPVHQYHLRFGLVLDQQRSDLLPLLAAGSDQWIPWVHNDDVARAIRFLIHSDEPSGPVNIVAPRAATTAALRRILMQNGSPGDIHPIQTLISSPPLISQRVIPARLNTWGFRFSYTDLEDALRMVFY